MQALLWGKDHVDLDKVVVKQLGPGVAAAITRGRHRKSYRYTDPNEDAAVAVVGPRATLLAVADGHNGWTATEAAMTTVVSTFGDDPPPPADIADDDLVELFHRATLSVLEATGVPGFEQPSSRTTLVIALVAPGEVRWASFGDSAVYVATGAGGATLSQSQHRFVGYPMPRAAVEFYLDRGRAEVPDGAWVVAASDGFVDYARPFPTTAFSHDNDAGAVARALVLAACEGGAGDNVAVAVARP
jgi:serine/threonine protein phosphatase PrpC